MSALADITVRAPSTLTPVVHHLPLYHVLCAGVEKRLFAECFWRSAAPRSRLPKKLAKFCFPVGSILESISENASLTTGKRYFTHIYLYST